MATPYRAFSASEKAAYRAGAQAAKKPKARKTSYKKKTTRTRSSAPRQPREQTAPAALGQEPGQVGLHVSNSTEAYMHGIANPSDAPACGMPIGGIPSEKNKCWSRGRMSTGTNKLGFILFSPSSIAANNIPCAWVTEDSFAGTVISAPGTPTAGVTPKTSNSPYGIAQFGSDLLKARFVCGEIRVRYIGTELNRGGDATVYCESNHNTLVGYDETKLLSYAACGRSFIGMNDWISCKYNGVVDPSEENFVNTPNANANTKNANPCMAIWINTAVASQPFDYEVWGHFEIIGSIAANMTTVTPDPTGHTATNSAAQETQINHPGSHEESHYMTGLLGKVFHTITTGASKVGDILSDKGTQKVIMGAIQKYGPKVLGTVAKTAPLLLL